MGIFTRSCESPPSPKTPGTGVASGLATRPAVLLLPRSRARLPCRIPCSTRGFLRFLTHRLQFLEILSLPLALACCGVYLLVRLPEGTHLRRCPPARVLVYHLQLQKVPYVATRLADVSDSCKINSATARYNTKCLSESFSHCPLCSRTHWLP